MWICSQLGFYSIVQKGGEWHVRARVRADLSNLLEASAVQKPILEWPTADYRFRVIVDARDMEAVFSALQRYVDYSNFKSKIHALPGQRAKSSAYGTLWANLAALQPDK